MAERGITDISRLFILIFCESKSSNGPDVFNTHCSYDNRWLIMTDDFTIRHKLLTIQNILLQISKNKKRIQWSGAPKTEQEIGIDIYRIYIYWINHVGLLSLYGSIHLATEWCGLGPSQRLLEAGKPPAACALLDDLIVCYSFIPNTHIWSTLGTLRLKEIICLKILNKMRSQFFWKTRYSYKEKIHSFFV